MLIWFWLRGRTMCSKTWESSNTATTQRRQNLVSHSSAYHEFLYFLCACIAAHLVQNKQTVQTRNNQHDDLGLHFSSHIKGLCTLTSCHSQGNQLNHKLTTSAWFWFQIYCALRNIRSKNTPALRSPMCFRWCVLEVIYDILHVKEQQWPWWRNLCSFVFLYIPRPAKWPRWLWEEKAAWVQPVQLGPTTFCACQKSFAYSLSFDERCKVKGNVLSPLVHISIWSAFCKSPVLCISVGII